MGGSSDEEFDLDYDDYDIIIVGGGLTGLTAAHSIMKKRANLSLLIIEAEDSPGGPLKSPGNFEFSAHTFQSHLLNLINELKIDVELAGRRNDNPIFLQEDNPMNEPSPIAALQVYYFLKSLDEYSLDPRLDPPRFDEECSILAESSVDDLICQRVLSPQARTICRALISLICGLMNLKNVSALWLLMMLHGARGLFQRFELLFRNDSRYFVKGGIPVLIENLRDKTLQADGVIKYSERVYKITFNEYRNFVATSRKTYKCAYVIIAVPPVRSAEITISTLPNNYEKIQNFYTLNPIIYFEVKYRNNFWHSKYSGIVVTFSNDDRDLKITSDITHPIENRVKTLSGLSSTLDYMSQQERRTTFFKIMNKFVDANEADDYIDYHEEEFHNGLTNVLKPCMIECHLNLMKAPFNRIFFAASEYASEWPGTADGAVEAGQHVACLLLYHARPQSLSRLEISKYISPRLRIPESNIQLFIAQTIMLIANTMIFWNFLRDAYDF